MATQPQSTSLGSLPGENAASIASVSIGANNPPQEFQMTVLDLLVEDPGVFLTDTAKRAALFKHFEDEAAKVAGDVDTDKGRKQVRSAAATVARAKAAIDKARLRLTSGWREQVKAVNDSGKIIEERLDSLAEAVRKPLTAWENAEKAREEQRQAIIASFRSAAVIRMDDTAAAVRARGSVVHSTVVDPELFGEMLDAAQAEKSAAINALKAAMARLTREEADKAELAKLRAEAAERDRIEAERLERERVEAQRAAEAKAAEERQAELARQAAEQARIDAEREAEAARVEQERLHAEALAAERRRAEDAERAAQAERDRIAAEEAKRIAAEEQARAEQAQREADQAHRAQVKAAAKEAIIAVGIPETKAVKLIQAIVAGDIPHVTMGF